MAIQFADRVQVSATANTTVSFTLGSALTGFQAFSVLTNGNTTYYAATDASGNWEVGLGTYSSTGPTLTRTTILSSSNSGSAVTFSGSVNVFITYPSGKVVILDASGNATALGTISSGTWQGTTVAVGYGGTGVTSSSGANSVVLRDANSNVTANNFLAGYNVITAAAGTTVLTNASAYYQRISGSTTQTIQLPNATTMANGQGFTFDNDSSGVVTIVDNASGAVDTVPSGGYSYIFVEDNSTSAGSWGKYALIPASYDFSTTTANFGTATITNATYNGNTISSGYGGTGLTTFTAANNALYSTSSSALAAGTLPVAAGGTGLTSTPTNGQIDIGNGSGFTRTTLTAGTGISVSNASGSITITNTSPSSGGTVTSVSGTGSVNGITLTGSVTSSGSLTLGGTLGSIANSQLTNSSVTVTAGTGLSGGGAVSLGSSVTLSNAGVTSLSAGTGISVSGSTGGVTVTNSGVTSLTGTSNQVSVSVSTGSVTLSTPQSIGTSSSVQFGSFGVGTAASGTTGEIRATNNVTAYYSSDAKFKENIHDVPNALEIVCAIGSKLFDWTDTYLTTHGGEDGYFIRKSDFGVIAQDVEKVFSRAVRTREDGSLAVDYEKLSTLAFGAIAQLLKRVEALENK
jgi:Chaperone of endosialidase